MRGHDKQSDKTPSPAPGCTLPLAALLIFASMVPAPAQTAATTPTTADQQAPKRKKMLERAAAVLKALGNASAKGPARSSRRWRITTLPRPISRRSTYSSGSPAREEAAGGDAEERARLCPQDGATNVSDRLDLLSGNVDGRKQLAVTTANRCCAGTCDGHQHIPAITRRC